MRPYRRYLMLAVLYLCRLPISMVSVPLPVPKSWAEDFTVKSLPASVCIIARLMKRIAKIAFS